MIQYLWDEDLNIPSDHKSILFCLNSKSGDMSNTGNNYPDQKILLFEKPEAFLWKYLSLNKFSKEFYLNTDNASILSTNNIGSNPKSQLPIDNRLENIADVFIRSTNTITKNQSTRSPETKSVCFSILTVNDEHRKPEFKKKHRG